MAEPEHITDADFTVIHPGDRQMPAEPAPSAPEPPWWAFGEAPGGGWISGLRIVFQLAWLFAFALVFKLVTNHYWPAPAPTPRPLAPPYTASNGYVVREIAP